VVRRNPYILWHKDQAADPVGRACTAEEEKEESDVELATVYQDTIPIMPALSQ